MKKIIALSAPIFLAGCFNTMDYPESIMPDVSWSFSEQSFSREDDFIEALYLYNQATSSTFSRKYFEASLSVNRIVVVYAYWIEGNGAWIERNGEVHLTSEWTEFSHSELLFKLHESVRPGLEDQDSSYFEGLEFSGEVTPNGTPIYIMHLGS